ncbi:CvpA family protein [Candidatus Legionella polyplacis]|uniref:CvpA family protein n=1 Tax=Candidatus Legionella polyplacis TaxID=2005262 RepID=A0ABZ2H182_9GAMM
MYTYFIDLFSVIIIVISSIVGGVRGFIKEIVEISSVFLFIWFSLAYAKKIVIWLQDYIENEVIRVLSVFVIIFLITLFFGKVVCNLLSFIIRYCEFNFLNHLIGVIFGVFRGFFLVFLMIFLSEKFLIESNYSYFIKSSKIYYIYNIFMEKLSLIILKFMKYN